MAAVVGCPGYMPSRIAASDETVIDGPVPPASRRNSAASAWAPVMLLVRRTRRAVVTIGWVTQTPGRVASPSQTATPMA